MFAKHFKSLWKFYNSTLFDDYVLHNRYVAPWTSSLDGYVRIINAAIIIDLMHWRHVSITTTPCWGSRLVALRAHVLLAERIGAHPLSQCAHPGQLGGEACRGLPSECMLGDGARGVPRLTPNTTGAPFCDVICIWSIIIINLATPFVCYDAVVENSLVCSENSCNFHKSEISNEQIA